MGKALDLARLRWEATLLARVGADAAGDAVRAGLAAAGVELVVVHDPPGTMRRPRACGRFSLLTTGRRTIAALRTG